MFSYSLTGSVVKTFLCVSAAMVSCDMNVACEIIRGTNIDRVTDDVVGTKFLLSFLAMLSFGPLRPAALACMLMEFLSSQLVAS